MKKIYTLAALLAGSYFGASAQNTLLIYTKFPNQIMFIDAFNKVIPSKALWNQQDGGYMISYNDPSNTYVEVSDPNAIFKLSDMHKLTKIISLPVKEKMSLQKCFNNEKYCCEQLSDKQKKGTEKLLAISVMKKGVDKSTPVVFSDNNFREISIKENLKIDWQIEGTIKSMYLLDITTLETVWHADNYNANTVTYAQLASGLKKPLEKKHKYQLNIVLNNDQNADAKYVYEFDYKDLAFETQEYHFVTSEAVKISWNTQLKIKKAYIRDITQNKNVWEAEKYAASSIDYSSIQAGAVLTPNDEYQLILELDNNEVYNYDFMVMLDAEESAALKQLVK